MKRITSNIARHRFVWILSLCFILFFIMENINGRFNLHDFQVDYTAAKHLRTDLPVYGQAFGISSGVYKYSPFTLFFIMPLTWIVHKPFIALWVFFQIFTQPGQNFLFVISFLFKSFPL